MTSIIGWARARCSNEPTDRPRQLLRRERLRGEAHERRQTGDDRGRVSRRGDASQALDGLVSSLIFADAGGVADRLSDRPIREAFAVGEAATTQDACVRRHDLAELRDESRLADTGFTDDRGGAASPLPHGDPEAVDESIELGLAPDHGAVGPPSRSPPLAVRIEGGRRIRPRPCPSQRSARPPRPWRHGPRGDRWAHRAGSRRAEPPAPDRAAVFTASPVTSLSPVDGSPVTTSPVCTPVRFVRRTPHEASSSWFSDARRSRIAAAARVARECVVFVGAGETEHGHDGIPDVLLHESPEPLEALAHGVEVTIEHLTKRLRVERFAESRRSDQVREDDRDRSAASVALRADERRGTGHAEPRLVRVLLPAALTEQHAVQSRTGSSV